MQFWQELASRGFKNSGLFCQESQAFPLLYKPARIVVTEDKVVMVFEKPEASSTVVTKLPNNTVVYIHEGKARNVQLFGLTVKSWVSIETRAGNKGWISNEYLSQLTKQESESIILNDQRTFENYLRDMILTAANNRIIESQVHPASNIERIWITSPIEPKSTSNNEVFVCAVMKGGLLGINRFKVDVKLNLFMDINRDNLSYINHNAVNVQFGSSIERGQKVITPSPLIRMRGRIRIPKQFVQ